MLRDAEIDVADRVVGRQRYRANELCGRRLGPALHQVEHPPQVPGLGEVGPFGQRRIDLVCGLRQAALRGKGLGAGEAREGRPPAAGAPGAARLVASGTRFSQFHQDPCACRCPDRRLTRGAGLATVAPHGPGVNRRHPIAAGPGAPRRRGRRRARDEMPDFPIVDAHVHLYDPGGDPLPVDGGQGGARGPAPDA